MDKPFRTFETGAIRDLDETKFDYEGFLSPYVLDAFGEYMHEKRKLADGSRRDGDNWQKGIPKSAYMKSAWRHFMDWWAHHRNLPQLAKEPLETALVGLLFNVSGYLHEVRKARLGEVAPPSPPPGLKSDYIPSFLQRDTFEVPEGFEAVRDAEGRATGEVRRVQEVQPEVQLELFEDLPVQLAPKSEQGDTPL